MLEQKQLDELLHLPVEERRQVLSLLQESLNQTDEAVDDAQVSPAPSPAARWILSLSGRYSSQSTDIAAHADEILSAEIDRRSGFTIKK
jgi:hypothetical protein